MAAVLKSDGPRLQLNLVPKTARIVSFRVCLGADELAGIIAKATHRTKNVCVCCGGRATTVDEVFTYAGVTQRFAGFIAVCRKCEDTRRARLPVMDLLSHLGSVNQFGLLQARQYVAQCLKVWETRNAVTYDWDLGAILDWIPASALPSPLDQSHPGVWQDLSSIDSLNISIRRPHAR